MLIVFIIVIIYSPTWILIFQCTRLVTAVLQHQKEPYEFQFVPEVIYTLLPAMYTNKFSYSSIWCVNLWFLSFADLQGVAVHTHPWR